MRRNHRDADRQTIAALFLLLGKAMETLPKDLRKIEIDQSYIDEALKLARGKGFYIGWKMDPKIYSRIWVAKFGGASKESLGVTAVRVEIDCLKKQRKFDV